MENPKYLIFVDFDGVLTSNRVHFAQEEGAYPLWSSFDPIVMEYFNKIHRKHDVGFVWTTTWRNHLQDTGHLQHILYSMWYNAGFRGNFAEPWRVNPDNLTNEEMALHRRAEEIKNYLEVYSPNCEDYLIFDDSDYNFNNVLGKKRFIKTDVDNGLLFKHMLKAQSIMGDWEKRNVKGK